ncbi:hypothetical protein FTO74_00750 [Granulicella sp. WH15]|uniref:hypothetical protein n=1 Tax=Granulicella sp. WH15 TaxID=2602070 RepID=UPI001366DBA9|nr:hypothetical protein [Granulicella sp. WH15]QHN02071.1 hypothetical protein FTO74_00750 [Granulicella sp. WH15]
MKNIIVRTFVLSLALTGAVSSAHRANASTAATIMPKLSAGPIPMCPPNDPHACGITELGH